MSEEFDQLDEFEEEIIDGQDEDIVEDDDKRRRILYIILGSLLVVLCIVSGLFCAYLRKPAPLPDLIAPQLGINYPPHYLFSIYGVDQPVGVAISPDEERVYVAESGFERWIKIFDREGDFLGQFAAPLTSPGHRSPVYLAVDSLGRVYVTDRLQYSIFVFDRDGEYLDTILGPDLTLSEYISKHLGGLDPEGDFAYNAFQGQVVYKEPGGEQQFMHSPDPPIWAPLGIRFNPDGEMIISDVRLEEHKIWVVSPDVVNSTNWQEFDPDTVTFGGYGQDNAQFLFPNSAVTDSRGWFYVSDGNNGRISVWDAQYNFRYQFGQGTGDGALNLPRGIFIDDRDRLYVVDAVGQDIKVYDVSEDEPNFLFDFGELGMGDGLFNYPNDIFADTTGRLYIVDRENHRIQVWSY